MFSSPKFDSKGNIQQFPGNTVVSNLYQNKDVRDLFRTIQSKYKSLPFEHKFAMLPEESVHMTVFELLCHFNRIPAYWSKHLDLNKPLESIDAHFHNQLNGLQFPYDFKMKILHINKTVINVAPADTFTSDMLQNFRDQLAAVTGVKFPNHETYQFHISFGYKVQELTEAEQNQVNQLNQEINQSFLSTIESIKIEKIDYTIFEDMSLFVPYSPKAREILRNEKGYKPLAKI